MSTLTKIMRKFEEKKRENCPLFSQNENIFVKIGEYFANFDKNTLIREIFLSFSQDFVTIFVSAVHIFL